MVDQDIIACLANFQAITPLLEVKIYPLVTLVLLESKI